MRSFDGQVMRDCYRYRARDSTRGGMSAQRELLTSHAENHCSPRWKHNSYEEPLKLPALTEGKEKVWSFLLHKT